MEFQGSELPHVLLPSLEKIIGTVSLPCNYFLQRHMYYDKLLPSTVYQQNLRHRWVRKPECAHKIGVNGNLTLSLIGEVQISENS